MQFVTSYLNPVEMAMETIIQFDRNICDYISSKSPVTVKFLQVIMATTQVARRRECQERLNRSAPYRHEHELNVSV